MLNIFVNTTTFGQPMAATFDIAEDGTKKLITPLDECSVYDAGYEQTISAEKLAEIAMSGNVKKMTSSMKAINAENIRVNSLDLLIVELNRVLPLIKEQETIDEDGVVTPAGEVVTVYVPQQLLRELHDLRVKFYVYGSSESSYYSQYELDLWKKALPLIQELFLNVVFKNIDGCRKNLGETKVQASKVNIYKSMYKRLLAAYKAEADSRKAEGKAVNSNVTADEDAFNN